MFTLPIDGFPVIYADPPWNYRVWSKKGMGRSAEHHYPTLKTQDIMDLPVKEIAAKNATLFLWATAPNLLDALKVGEAWGFTYKTCAFAWAKAVRSKFGKPTNNVALDQNWHVGMGYYSRANVELVLLFTRGNPPERLSKSVRQLIVAPVGRHSEKPVEVHTRIEQLVAGPYLELFGRQPYPGWEVLGNEIDGLDIRDSLEYLQLTRGMELLPRLEHFDYYLSILNKAYKIPNELLDTD